MLVLEDLVQASLVKGTALPSTAKLGLVASGELTGGLIQACLTNLSRVKAKNISSNVNNSSTNSIKVNSSSNIESHIIDIHNSLKSGGSFN